LQQEISVAANAGGRKYNETTPVDGRSEVGIANAMRMATKEKANKLYMKMMKLVVVAKPTNEPEFLEEMKFKLYTTCMTSLCFQVQFFMNCTCYTFSS